MASLCKAVLVIVLGVLLAGCTLHFKATDLELDTERQRVNSNRTYELESVGLLDG